MQITKIKIELIKTEVCYTEESGNTILETKVKCEKPRAPEFTNLSQSFIGFIIETLKLPLAWESYDNSFITSIKFDYTDSGIGVVFEISHRLAGFGVPLTIKTPRYAEGTNIKFESTLPHLIADKLYRLAEHAQDFVRGKRDQRDLFGDQDDFIEEEVTISAGKESVKMPLSELNRLGAGNE